MLAVLGGVAALVNLGFIALAAVPGWAPAAALWCGAVAVAVRGLVRL